MAGAHQEKEPAAPGRRPRPGQVRKGAVLHAAPRRYDGLQEYPLPQALRDHERAERGISGLGSGSGLPALGYGPWLWIRTQGACDGILAKDWDLRVDPHIVLAAD